MKPFQRILMATDFSEASAPAWRRAVAVARENQAELFVAHAYQPPNLAQAGIVAPAVYDEWDDSLRMDVSKKLQLLINDAKKSGVRARPVVLTGVPDAAITKAASDNEVDLLILGTHGRTGFSRLLLGSVAARVISTAPCAVLTVRMDDAVVGVGATAVSEPRIPALEHETPVPRIF